MSCVIADPLFRTAKICPKIIWILVSSVCHYFLTFKSRVWSILNNYGELSLFVSFLEFQSLNRAWLITTIQKWTSILDFIFRNCNNYSFSYLSSLNSIYNKAIVRDRLQTSLLVINKSKRIKKLFIPPEISRKSMAFWWFQGE